MTLSAAHDNPRTAARPGMTLIEILVVVGIIAVLIAIGFGLRNAVSTQAREDRTRIVFRIAQNALVDYQSTTGYTPGHNDPDHTVPLDYQDQTVEGNLRRYDWSDRLNYNVESYAQDNTPSAGELDISSGNNYDTFAEKSGARFVWIVERVPSIANMFRSLDDKSIYTPVKMSTATSDSNLPGSEVSEGYFGLLDGWGEPIVYVAYQQRGDDCAYDDFLRERPTGYFASAGGNRHWGEEQYAEDLRDGDSLSGNNLTEGERAMDNLYSFDVE